MTKGLEFDPGFGPYVMAFSGTLEYLYADINKYKNFSQRKMKFMQYHKKILEIFSNNLGFFTGCLMWAAYIKTQKEQPILNNPCLGQEYNEEENIYETEFMIKFTQLFPKDMKYFLGQDFSFNPEYTEVLDLYKTFLTENKGFVETKNNTDIKIPEKMITKNAETFDKIITSVIETGNLSKLLDYTNLICPKS